MIIRTWQTSHKMKVQRGTLNSQGTEQKADNFWAKRYVAKYTIKSAIAHGIAQYVGSRRRGKISRFMFVAIAFFDVKPASSS